MLHVLKMKLTKAKSHLAHLQSVEKKKEEEYVHARDLAIEQARYLVEIQNQHDQAFQRVMEGSAVGSATSEGPGLEELSEDGAQLQAMSDDDPDLAPKEWAQSEDPTEVALSPPPPKFPRVLPAKSNALMRSVLRSQLGTWTRCKLCMLGVRKGWNQRLKERLKGNCLKGAESGFHSQEHSLHEGHGLSGSFSHEEGWTLVKRRKDKKASHKEEKKKERKAIKKVLCKDKVSSLICRAPSLRTGKKTSSFKSPNFVVPSSIVQDPGIKGALFQEDCCQEGASSFLLPGMLDCVHPLRDARTLVRFFQGSCRQWILRALGGWSWLFALLATTSKVRSWGRPCWFFCG